MKWKRTTVNADKTFTIMFPYFTAAGALHIEDVLHLYVLNDPLGIRGRLGLFVSRPTFRRAREVEEAASSLSDRRYGLEDKLRKKFTCTWQAHDPIHGCSTALFEKFKGNASRVYDFTEDAKPFFMEQFDKHTTAHEAKHPVDYAGAKFHSKAKTKFLRHALAVHLAEQARVHAPTEAWSTQVPKKALQFGFLLSDYMDRVDSAVELFFAGTPAENYSATVSNRT